jgi:hypothetical protein
MQSGGENMTRGVMPFTSVHMHKCVMFVNVKRYNWLVNANRRYFCHIFYLTRYFLRVCSYKFPTFMNPKRPSILSKDHAIVSYCGVFTPCKNCNIETRSHDYAIVDEAVFSSFRGEQNLAEAWTSHSSRHLTSLLPGSSYKHLDNARVRKGHMTALATTQQLKVFSRMSDPRVYRSPQ